MIIVQHVFSMVGLSLRWGFGAEGPREHPFSFFFGDFAAKKERKSKSPKYMSNEC